MVGSNIAYKTDRQRVNGGETEDLAMACTRFPFRYLLPILKARIQHINGTTEDTSMTKIVATRTGAAEKLDGSETVSTGM